jgi:poly-gamma-glutamate system protein
MFASKLIAPTCAAALGAALLVASAPVGAVGTRSRAARATAPDPARVSAAALMARSLTSIKALRAAKSIAIDPATDPNGTGIVGDEFTPLTTSLGDADAKRTAASPAFAAVMVGYFQRLDLRRGDVIAVGASGSFPGFVLATLCAARTLGLEPIVIYSVGSSMYGANLPGFTFVDMLDGLRRDGLVPFRLAAVSPGGDDDAGGGVLFDDDGSRLRDEARRSGVRLVRGRSLNERVADRLRIYDEIRGGRPIAAFVNIGGSAASYGDTEASLEIPNGLVGSLPARPAASRHGLVFEFAARHVPVVHLLFVRGLARDHRLPFDPVPLPSVGEGAVYTNLGGQ